MNYKLAYEQKSRTERVWVTAFFVSMTFVCFMIFFFLPYSMQKSHSNGYTEGVTSCPKTPQLHLVDLYYDLATNKTYIKNSTGSFQEVNLSLGAK